MPIYEYGCGDCGHVFEEMILSGDAEPEKCPSCGNAEIGRLVSNTAFKLEGSGWYVTDYKDSGTPAPATSTEDTSTDSSSAEPSESPGTGTSDSSSSSDTDTAA